MMRSNEECDCQHDDHVWLKVGGENWAIKSIEYPVIYLWRGYAPCLEFSSVDVSAVDWNAYESAATEMIRTG